MGFFDFDGGSVISGRSSHTRRKSKRHSDRSRGRARSRSRSSSNKYDKGFAASAASFFAGEDYQKNSASRGSFFGVPNASRSSFFGFGSSRPSYYKRSPRQGFMYKAKKTVKRLWRDLKKYAKEHPMKVVMLVIMPLLTGGFLTTLLAKFGLRLPPGVEKLIGVGARAASGDSVGLMSEAVRFAGSSFGGGGQTRSVSVDRGFGGDGMQWERKTVEKDFDWGSAFGEVAKFFK